MLNHPRTPSSDHNRFIDHGTCSRWAAHFFGVQPRSPNREQMACSHTPLSIDANNGEVAEWLRTGCASPAILVRLQALPPPRWPSLSDLYRRCAFTSPNGGSILARQFGWSSGVPHLTIDNLTINADGSSVSFTARLWRQDATTTIASYASLGQHSVLKGEVHHLIERRVSEMLERPSPSGRSL